MTAPRAAKGRRGTAGAGVTVRSDRPAAAVAAPPPRLRPAGKAGAGGVGLGGAVLSAWLPRSRQRLLTSATSSAGAARDAGLAVREVRVEGARNTPRAALREAIGVRPGDPHPGLLARGRARRLEEHRLGGERRGAAPSAGHGARAADRAAPFAIWQKNGRFAVIDREGRVVATDRLDAFGPCRWWWARGPRSTAAALHDLLREAPDVLIRTQAMVRVGQRRWNLRLQNGAEVLLPEGQEDAAIRRLAELQRQNAMLDRPLAAVDLRLPDRLVVRQLPAPAPQPAEARRGSGRG